MSKSLPDPSEPTKAYYVEYTIHEKASALVYARNAQEAKRKFRDGEDEWRGGCGEAHVAGISSVYRSPEDDRAA